MNNEAKSQQAYSEYAAEVAPEPSEPAFPPAGAVSVCYGEHWQIAEEPDESVDVVISMSVADAIRFQRAMNKLVGKGSDMSDRDLLGDFVSVNWAWFADEEGRRL